MPFDIYEREKNSILILDLIGDMEGDGFRFLKRKVEQRVEEGRVHILLNLSKLEYMDSSGLGGLISQSKKVKEKGGKFMICQLSDPIKELVVVTGLHMILDLYEEETDALESLS